VISLVTLVQQVRTRWAIIVTRKSWVKGHVGQFADGSGGSDHGSQMHCHPIATHNKNRCPCLWHPRGKSNHLYY